MALTASSLFVFSFVAAACIAVIPSVFAVVTLASVFVSALLMFSLAVFAAFDTACFSAVTSSLVKPLLPSITPFCFVTSAFIASIAAALFAVLGNTTFPMLVIPLFFAVFNVVSS